MGKLLGHRQGWTTERYAQLSDDPVAPDLDLDGEAPPSLKKEVEDNDDRS